MNDASMNLDHIIAEDGRIIIGYFDEERAVQTLCKVRGMERWGQLCEVIWEVRNVRLRSRGEGIDGGRIRSNEEL